MLMMRSIMFRREDRRM